VPLTEGMLDLDAILCSEIRIDQNQNSTVEF